MPLNFLTATAIVLASIVLSTLGRSLFDKPTTKATLALDIFFGIVLAIGFLLN